MNNLSIIQNGHYSSDYGLKTSDEITAMYNAEEFYDATRKSWVVGNGREDEKYVIATYRGLTRKVYEIIEWYQIDVNGKTRWGFNGHRPVESTAR